MKLLCPLVFFLVFTFVGQATAQTWTELTPTGEPPSKREFHSAVYDLSTNRMTVFGGVTFAAGFLDDFNDVWVLENADGQGGTPNWTQLFPTGSPPSPRTNTDGSVYDAASNRMIVFGGNPNVGYCFASANDVWVLENANGQGGTPNWIQLSPTGGLPSQRYTHTSVYDAATNRMIVFGGEIPCGPHFNDVWVLGKRQKNPIFPRIVSTCHDKPNKSKEAKHGKENINRGTDTETGVLEAAYRGVQKKREQSGRVLPSAQTEHKIIHILEEEIQAECPGLICPGTGEG